MQMYERTCQGYFKYKCSVSFYFELSEVDFTERELTPQENTEDAKWLCRDTGHGPASHRGIGHRPTSK